MTLATRPARATARARRALRVVGVGLGVGLSQVIFVNNDFGDSPRPRDRSRQARPACTHSAAE